LDAPVLHVQDITRPGIAGTYSPYFETVTVEPGTPSWVAVHEIAHHFFYACRIADRPVGRFYERLTGESLHNREGVENWATTFTWILTGSQQGGAYEIHPEARPAFRKLLAAQPRMAGGTPRGSSP
jgi:hypothetical protein